MNDVESARRTVSVISVPIDTVNWETAVSNVTRWAEKGESRYVCTCNVHSLVTALKREDFAAAIAHADMATPDGAPVAWMLRHLGAPKQARISGPDLMLRVCEAAAEKGLPIYLYGNTTATLEVLKHRLIEAYPGLNIVGTRSPPFRALSATEIAADNEEIRNSGARLVFVSLGCPKQEIWMAQHSRDIGAVMLGVGAAFDFHAGILARAPHYLQFVGLEWLHRLGKEPRRLWKRYLITNTVFVLHAARQLLTRRTNSSKRLEVLR